MITIFPQDRATIISGPSLQAVKDGILNVVRCKDNNLHLVKHTQTDSALTLVSQSSNVIYFNSFSPTVYVELAQFDSNVNIVMKFCLQKSIKCFMSLILSIAIIFELCLTYLWANGQLVSNWIMVIPPAISICLLSLSSICLLVSSKRTLSVICKSLPSYSHVYASSVNRF